MRVLIVDDSSEYRRYLRRILEQEGLVLEGEAADGEAGILLAQQLRPDVILMDIHLPGVDGLDATRRIKEGHLARTAVIILSNDETCRDAAAACGADAFLSKCSSISEILSVIRRVRQLPKTGCSSGLVAPNRNTKA
jgi:DNA-binding NarL/FixJ family response regulator